MRLSMILGCAALTAAACGGGGSGPTSEPLTCEWLAGAKNCWSSAAVMAVTCLPGLNNTGTFSADNSTCSYPGGESVNFTPPLVLPLQDEHAWNFTVNGPNGQACLHYEETGTALELQVRSQTVTVDKAASGGLSIVCPDGSSAGTTSPLPDCAGGSIALPGNYLLASDTSVLVAIAGLASSTPIGLFNCMK